jgi:hypothetical protein
MPESEPIDTPRPRGTRALGDRRSGSSRGRRPPGGSRRTFIAMRSRFCASAVLGACLLGVSAISAVSAHASGTRLQLLSNGSPVGFDQRSAVINEAEFPGFTCSGFNGDMSFRRTPAKTLRFKFPLDEGGSEGFNYCTTDAGEEVAIVEPHEGDTPHLREVTMTAQTVTETFKPRPLFEDDETGCLWELRKLAGPLPRSGSLHDVQLSGPLRLLVHLSSTTCPGVGDVTDITTIEAAPEGAPPGSYEVERLP